HLLLHLSMHCILDPLTQLNKACQSRVYWLRGASVPSQEAIIIPGNQGYHARCETRVKIQLAYRTERGTLSIGKVSSGASAATAVPMVPPPTSQLQCLACETK